MTLDDIMRDVTLARTVRAPRCGVFWFKSQTVRVFEGGPSIVAGGQTWQGLGDLAAIEGPIEMGPGLKTQPLNLSINFTAAFIQNALTAAQQSDELRGRYFQLGIIPLGQRNADMSPVPGKEWQAAMDPWIFATYVMDKLSVEFDREKDMGRALLTILPQTADKHMAPAGSLTDADQQYRYPGDTSLARRSLYRSTTTLIW